jgi:hypothetical protein
MSDATNVSSRRDFMSNVGRLASAAALTACVPPASAHGGPTQTPAPSTATGEWDLSWLDRLTTATDRAVFDWPSAGDPADPIVLELAERYLDNCATIYRPKTYEARVVLNIRTQAVGAALNDTLWARYSLGAEYSIKDPNTKELAVRNPYWHRAPSPAPGITLPTISDLISRGALILVCDFALGHLSKRLATKTGRNADDVHRDLLGGFVPQSYAVPSGIFGLARAQNAGCGLVRM